MPSTRLTVAELRDSLAAYDGSLEVWVVDGASSSGFSPALGIYDGRDDDPSVGEPAVFVVIDVAQ